MLKWLDETLLLGGSGSRWTLWFASIIFVVAAILHVNFACASEYNAFGRSGAFVLAISFGWFARNIAQISRWRMQQMINEARIEARDHLVTLTSARLSGLGQDAVIEAEEKGREVFKLPGLEKDTEAMDETLSHLEPRHTKAMVIVTVVSTFIWGFGDLLPGPSQQCLS